MFFYARSDTHFLLYIYDNLRNELVEKSDQADPENNRIEKVLQKSKETSLMCYKKDIYDKESGKGPGGWFTLLTKTPQIQSSEQLAVFRAVHEWRDRIARKDDDSVNHVMPNHVLVTISTRVPTDMTSLYGVIHPISHNVKSRTGELLDVIKEAKAAGVNGPTAMDVLKPDSLGAVLKRARESNEITGTAGDNTRSSSMGVNLPTASEQGPLRSESSKFWGTAFGSSIWDSSVSALRTIREGLTLAVPMPQLSSEVFSSQTPVSGNSLQTPRADKTSAEETKSKTGSDENVSSSDKLYFTRDETFRLKQGLKRKSDAMASGDEEADDRDEDAIALDEAEEEALRKRRGGNEPGTGKKYRKQLAKKLKAEEREREKAERKKARNESRRGSYAALTDAGTENDVDMAHQEDAEDDEEEGEEEDFDYSKAESVLHSKSRKGGGAHAGIKKEKSGKKSTPFDPYTKSANAAKGMRRQQSAGDGEKGGRSATFRS